MRDLNGPAKLERQGILHVREFQRMATFYSFQQAKLCIHRQPCKLVIPKRNKKSIEKGLRLQATKVKRTCGPLQKCAEHSEAPASGHDTKRDAKKRSNTALVLQSRGIHLHATLFEMSRS